MRPTRSVVVATMLSLSLALTVTCASVQLSNHSGIRIFVYPIADSFGNSFAELNPLCDPHAAEYSWHRMYTTEVLVFEALRESPMLTLDASQANLFFVPVFPSCHLHTSIPVDADGLPPKKALNFTATSEYLGDVLRTVRENYPYFNASNGADHFMMLTHDIGRGLLGDRRSDFGRMFFLTHTGDTVPRPEHYGQYIRLYDNDETFAQTLGHPCFEAEQDIVIPPYTGIQVIGSAHHCNEGDFSSCPALPPRSQLLVDSPITGDNNAEGARSLLFAAPPKEAYPRRKLASFRGSVSSSADDIHSFGTRQRLLERQKSAQPFKSVFVHPAVPGGDPSRSLPYRKAYFLDMLMSTFCLCLPGFAPWTARLYEAVLFGCIPVVVESQAAELPFARSPFNADGILWVEDILVVVGHDDVDTRLEDMLKELSTEEIERRQRNMLSVRDKLWYSHGWSDGALAEIMSQLRTRIVSQHSAQ